MTKPTEKELALLVSNGVNNMSFDNVEFAKTMGNEHRTLQQNFTGLCLTWLYHLADQSSDLRNEASVEAAKKVKEALGEYGDSLPRV